MVFLGLSCVTNFHIVNKVVTAELQTSVMDCYIVFVFVFFTNQHASLNYKGGGMEQVLTLQFFFIFY